ncbi:MAG: cation transporter [Planctomycetota bacterium]
MKTLATSALALCLLVMIGCAEGNVPSADALTTFENASNKIEANVTGMDCAGCSGSIEAAVADIKGVEAVMVDIASGDVKVALSDEAEAEAKMAEIESAIQALSDGKFTVQTITVSTDAEAETKPVEEPAADEPASEEQASTEDASVEFTSYKVDGMSCAGCSKEVAFVVEDIEGVSECTACHKSGTVMVAFKDGVSAEDKAEQIKTAIAGLEDGKYTVSN